MSDDSVMTPSIFLGTFWQDSTDKDKKLYIDAIYNTHALFILHPIDRNGIPHCDMIPLPTNIFVSFTGKKAGFPIKLPILPGAPRNIVIGALRMKGFAPSVESVKRDNEVAKYAMGTGKGDPSGSLPSQFAEAHAKINSPSVVAKRIDYVSSMLIFIDTLPLSDLEILQIL